MGLVPLVFTTGWASGVNVYGVVLVMGALARLGLVDGTPAQLQQTPILVAAAVMFGIEFFADKIPYLDSAWDAVHTVIRPVSAAYIGGLIGHDSAAMSTALGAAIGGGTALTSHLVKAIMRLAVNASPEPFSNIVISSTEDLAVISLAGLALAHPRISASICAVLLVFGVAIALMLFKFVRRGLRAWQTRRRRAAPGW